MNGLLVLTPLISMFIGWLGIRLMIKMLFHPVKPLRVFGFTCQGILIKRQAEFIKNLSILISENLFSYEVIEAKLVNAGNFQKTMPLVEEHIDHFLKVKLKESMPVIGMFVGDRTISQLKTVFMAELDVLFPVIMKDYIFQLKNELDVQKIVTEKIIAFSSKEVELTFHKLFFKELLYCEVAGAVVGLFIGMIYLMFLLIFIQ